jgi:hypothetical protein
LTSFAYGINSLGAGLTMVGTALTSTISQYTDALARASISLTTTGSGAATYSNTTGALNIPTPTTYSGTNFILNQNSSAQTGNYWITGTAKINNSVIQSYTSGSGTNDALEITGSSDGAVLRIRNTGAGYSGIEYGTSVFSGVEPLSNNFRFNAYAGGIVKFLVSSVSMLHLDPALGVQIPSLTNTGNKLASFDGNHSFYATAIDPANVIQQSNVSTGLVYSSGLKSKSYVICNNFSPVGNVGAGEDDLMTFSIPAGILATNGDSIYFETIFQTNTNGNSKELKLYLGTDAIYDIAALSNAGGGVCVNGRITRIDATNQIVTFWVNSLNNPSVGSFAPTTQTLSSAIIFKATGTAVANNDIVQKLLFMRYEGV